MNYFQKGNAVGSLPTVAQLEYYHWDVRPDHRRKHREKLCSGNDSDQRLAIYKNS